MPAIIHKLPLKDRPYRLTTINAAALAATTFESVSYIVPRYIAPGLTILAGRPKAGKSWLALNIAEAIASGGSVLGEQVQQGDVLYLALEDNQRRLQRRLDQLNPFSAKPMRLVFATECNRLDHGGLDAIEAWCDSVPNPRLIVIDVLGRVRAERRRDESPYDYDYRSVTPLKALADRRGIAVLVLHHTNKRHDHADELDAVSGTTGLAGAADAIFVLARTPEGPTLYGRGRDIDDIETALRFDPVRGHFAALGDATDVRRTDERKMILDALRGSNGPMSPTDIAGDTGMKSTNVRKLLGKMVKASEVEKIGRGKYGYPYKETDHNDH